MNLKYSIALLLLCTITLIELSAQSHFGILDFTKTTSGLEYKISKTGKGYYPKTGDRVWVHYMGFLENDSLFSSSMETGPLDVFLGQGQIINGWEEGLRLIKPGGSIVLKVPPELAYGSEGNYDVPPNSTLYFEIALVQVNSGVKIKPFDVEGKPQMQGPKKMRFVKVEDGVGPLAKPGDNAYVHYTAYVNDTLIFDSSLKKDGPVRINVGSNQVFEGWDLAIQQMNLGSKYRFYIPSKLAYGKKGYGTIVPPNADIIMDIEMTKLTPEIMVKPWEVKGLPEIKTASGLRYYVVEEGEGERIEKENIITLHYSGYFENGNVFDSSVKREEPFRIPAGIGALIDGWDEALLLMRKGSKFQLHIPAALGYGAEGVPPDIPGNLDLIFDVEILDIYK